MYLHFKAEILFHVLDDHDEEGEFDSEGFLGVGGTGDVGRAHVGPNDFQDEGLNVIVSDPLDVSISNLLI